MEKQIIVHIENNFDNLVLKNNYDKILIITDENVKKIYIDSVLKKLSNHKTYIYSLIPGEESKSLKVYSDIFEYAISSGLTRKSLVISLGGGVVGDIGGFVASTYMRGIDLVHCPTTLLAQVDSSIGGKTGINIGNYKNVMGTFYNPIYIYSNISTLKTLKREDFIGGMSEVIKYGLIWDYDFISFIEYNKEKILNLDIDILKEVVKKCADIKIKVVKEDERENGIRKILNLGHSFGHGLEKIGKLSHGYAVSIGTNMAFKLALRRELIDSEYYYKLLDVYKYFNLPTTFKDIDEKEILDIMKKDKKNSFSKYNLILPIDYGKVDVFDDVTEEEILITIKEVKNEL
ncbi:3-dehydroquinate synthase [Alkalithermobacter paradoxus]|uniref:3-dehydroquinate synthase n=1 Tax=Alkalithermobacter paradoxus TaxID=29349 RepID=A0A1V4IA78_9FIRM|nr:3-dehydroquinate synthase [[Clostridium] thermoalcaliphilum]